MMEQHCHWEEGGYPTMTKDVTSMLSKKCGYKGLERSPLELSSAICDGRNAAGGRIASA